MNFDPNLESQGSEEFDRLLAGDKRLVTGSEEIGANQDLVRGTILGLADDGFWYEAETLATPDGREVQEAVLAEDTDTTDGATAEAPVYFEGTFNRTELTAVDAINEEQLRDHGIHVKDTVAR